MVVYTGRRTDVQFLRSATVGITLVHSDVALLEDAADEIDFWRRLSDVPGSFPPSPLTDDQDAEQERQRMRYREAMEAAAEYCERNNLLEAPKNERGYSTGQMTGADKLTLITRVAASMLSGPKVEGT